MTTEQWRTVIRRLGTLGTIRIKFQGGEPTLRPDFRELCAEAKAAGMIAATVSHGLTILTQPALLDYLDELVVSLDSPDREINDRLRGPGSYDGAVQAIDLALQRGLRTYVNMVVVRDTLGEMEPMLEFCEARGIMMHPQPVMFDQKSLYGQYFDDTAQHLALTPEQIRAMHTRLIGWKRQGRNLMFSSPAYDKATNWPDYDILTIPSNGRSSCMAGKDYIHIEPNGDVHPCGLHSADFTPKNVLKDSLDEALLHARYHNCGDCWMVYLNERKAVFGLKPAALREVVRRG
jgi:MoaA/NifB/PqqE/SkfB family radical SAM enzyme